MQDFSLNNKYTANAIADMQTFLSNTVFVRLLQDVQNNDMDIISSTSILLFSSHTNIMHIIRHHKKWTLGIHLLPHYDLITVLIFFCFLNSCVCKIKNKNFCTCCYRIAIFVSILEFLNLMDVKSCREK